MPRAAQHGFRPGAETLPILEVMRAGRLLRVSAMDPRTLTEVVAYGPARAGEAALRRLALAKLAQALRRTARH